MADHMNNIDPDMIPKATAAVGGLVAVVLLIMRIISIPKRVKRLEDEQSILMRYAFSSGKFMLACTKTEKDEARKHLKETMDNMENYITRPRR